jgi:hypothetical protein
VALICACGAWGLGEKVCERLVRSGDACGRVESTRCSWWMLGPGRSNMRLELGVLDHHAVRERDDGKLVVQP